MKPSSIRCTFRLAVGLVTAAAWMVPRRMRARYRDEWMAELEAYQHESIDPLFPALRILFTSPATRSGLRSANRDAAWMGIPRRMADRLFIWNNTEAYWRGWQITKTHAGISRRYRNPRFDTINPTKNRNLPVA